MVGENRWDQFEVIHAHPKSEGRKFIFWALILIEVSITGSWEMTEPYNVQMRACARLFDSYRNKSEKEEEEGNNFSKNKGNK